MEVSLLDIQTTSQENQYLTTVLVDDSVHQFTITVNDTPAPMLTILGDQHFYEVLGRNYSLHRPLLEEVGLYHLNGAEWRRAEIAHHAATTLEAVRSGSASSGSIEDFKRDLLSESE